MRCAAARRTVFFSDRFLLEIQHTGAVARGNAAGAGQGVGFVTLQYLP